MESKRNRDRETLAGNWIEYNDDCIDEHDENISWEFLFFSYFLIAPRRVSHNCS